MKASFGIIGGDKRQLYLAKSIQNDGYTVYICGFELSCDTNGLTEIRLEEILNKADYIILPLPCTRDNETIFSPYSDKDILVNDSFVNSLKDKTVYGGCMQLLTNQCNLWEKIKYFDYYKEEELAISNAIPTAEGAVSLAIENHNGILNDSKCLITGYGRIGKVLSKILLSFGANVDIAARKKEDYALIRALGAKSVKYQKINKTYDIIFNTVPTMVIEKDILKHQNADTVIIELASLPGGIDRKFALLNGIKIIDAQSLPGKVAPKATAEFTKETIYNLLD